MAFYTDAACTNLITSWKESDGCFSVAYNTAETGASVMTIEMTEQGLNEINSSTAVYADASMVNSGFSDCTVRITYTARLDSDNSVAFGDKGNDNKVILTWKRTSDSFFDTLVDDCHIFSYLEFVCTDSCECFDENKAYLQSIAKKERNPNVQKLILKRVSLAICKPQ